jgi:c-di-GMP-binding flagellar brake protein YcgR
MTLQVQCGFVILKIGASKTAEILAKTLEANEARGRRKFVRAPCNPGVGQCAVDFEGATLRAELTDLSSAGMAIRFRDSAGLKVGTVLRDMSLTIKGQRLSASGVVVAKRDGENGLVIMFDPSSIDEARRDKLKSIVFKVNQLTMDLALERA